MLLILIEHALKRILRAVRFDLNFFLSILSKFIFTYFLFILSIIGYKFEQIIHLLSSSSSTILLFKDYIFHLIVVLFFVQLLFIKNPIKELSSYLHLPIKKYKLIVLIIIFNVANPVLMSIIFFFIPYLIGQIYPIYSIQSFLSLTFGFLLICITIGLLSLSIRNIIEISLVFVCIPILLILLIYLINILSIATFKMGSNLIYENLIYRPKLSLLLLSLIVLGFKSLNYILIKRSLYNLYDKNDNILDIDRIYFVKSYNIVLLDYIYLEFRLLIRNKRLKGLLILTIIMLTLFYYFLPRNSEGVFYTFIIYIIFSGFFGYIFLQYLFSWESAYFEFILSKKFDIIRYLKAKYYIYLVLGIICFLIFVPIIKPKLFDLHLFFSAVLYNSSFGYFIYFFLSTYNKDKIDITGDFLFNLQGFNRFQVLGLLFIIFIPYSILYLLSLIMKFTNGLLLFNFFCFLALVNQKKWWQIIHRQFYYRKYINLAGYRQ
jgi:hypothetical protein